LIYETILVLAFQAINGYVYWQLGALFAAFMLGLALGSGFIVRYVPPTSPARSYCALRFLLGVSGLQGLSAVWLLPYFQQLAPTAPHLILFSAALFITALWVGMAFPLASHLARPEPIEAPAALARRLVILHFDSLRSESAFDPGQMPAFARLASIGASGRSRTPAVSTTGPSIKALFSGEDVSLADFLRNFEVRVDPDSNVVPFLLAGGSRAWFAGPLVDLTFAEYNSLKGERWEEARDGFRGLLEKWKLLPAIEIECWAAWKVLACTPCASAEPMPSWPPGARRT